MFAAGSMSSSLLDPVSSDPSRSSLLSLSSSSSSSASSLLTQKSAQLDAQAVKDRIRVLELRKQEILRNRSGVNQLSNQPVTVSPTPHVSKSTNSPSGLTGMSRSTSQDSLSLISLSSSAPSDSVSTLTASIPKIDQAALMKKLISLRKNTASNPVLESKQEEEERASEREEAFENEVPSEYESYHSDSEHSDTRNHKRRKGHVDRVVGFSSRNCLVFLF